MPYSFEYIASGKLAKANGGGACSQTSNYKVVVCFASLDNKICIAERDVRSHAITGIANSGVRPKPHDNDYTGWAVTTVFNHADPAGGGDSAVITSPPVLWVARSGEYLPATTTPACQTNILHLAWVAKYTEGTNIDCYQVFHAMRKSNGAWTCAAGTLASLNAITAPSATTGEWKNPQLLGMRRWDATNSRYESYGVDPDGACTTLYLTYFGRDSNSGSTPNDIWLTFFGGVSSGRPIGNDWDDTQTWYGTHKNMSSTAYSDALHSAYTLGKVDRTTAPTRVGSVATFYHTADTTSSYQYHYMTVSYSRKAVPLSAGGSRTGYFPRYRKYTPSTNTVDASESDPTLISSITSLTSGKDSAVLTSPEQEGYIFDGFTLFRPKSGGSSGIAGQNAYKKDNVFLGHPIISGHLVYYETNESRALQDGDSVKSTFVGNFNNWFTQTTRRKIEYPGSNPQPNVTLDFDFWPLDWPIQHASAGISRNWIIAYQGAQDLTPNVYGFNTRTGEAPQVIGGDALFLAVSMRYGAGAYTGLTREDGSTIAPSTFTFDSYYNTVEAHHPTHGGNRYRGATYQIWTVGSSAYELPSTLTANDITWPMFGNWNCVNPCVFRAPYFQDGSMPYTMKVGNAIAFEAYQVDGTDNAVWIGFKSSDLRFADNTATSIGCYETHSYDGLVNINNTDEHEWRRNTQPIHTMPTAFKGETIPRYLVRTTIRQDESPSSLIARPTYSITFNYDIYNANGDLTNRWEQAAEPKVFHGIGQYEATSNAYILIALKNQTASAVRTANVTGRAKIGTVSFADGVQGETHWQARIKSYTNSLLIDSTDGRVAYIWIRWTPPGGQTNPPTPQAIDIRLQFNQAT